jgi:hypothetical protein
MSDDNNEQQDGGGEASTRKPGQPISDSELQQLPADTVINRVSQFIRSDFGGKPGESKEKAALNSAWKRCPEIVPILEKLSADEQRAIGRSLIVTAEHTAAGSRKRVARYLGEMRRRWGSAPKPTDPHRPSPIKF